MNKILLKTVGCLLAFTVVLSMSGMVMAQKDIEAHPPIHVNKAATSAPVGYSPAQIRKAYGLDQLTATGTGQTIAIVDAYGSPTIASDLTKFCSQFNLPAAKLSIAYPTGKPRRVDSGWVLETSLDVEWAHAIAPGATILLCIAPSASTNDLLAAIDYASAHGATVVSNSWGGIEFANEATYDSHFTHTGTTFVASSGDSGSGAEWPASSPNVVSVGGTSLKLDSTGTYLGETAWSQSGGGPSKYESVPAYQTNWASITSSNRGTPDISWDADPATGVAIYDSTQYSGRSGWFQIGGTSVGSPCIAALIAVTNQGRSVSFGSYDFITQLYNAAGNVASQGYQSDFHDITQGSNGAYTTQTGYDLVTGIGTPQAKSLVSFLNTAP